MPQENKLNLQFIHYRCYHYYVAVSMHAPSVSPLTPTIGQLLLAIYTLLHVAIAIIPN